MNLAYLIIALWVGYILFWFVYDVVYPWVLRLIQRYLEWRVNRLQKRIDELEAELSLQEKINRAFINRREITTPKEKK